MYQALYRKWRPKDFDSVVGQEHITVTLKNEVAAGKFSHAYLFTGSRGTGKTTCSKIIAKAVNCLSPVGGNPCNECSNCRGIDEGSILDVVEIDAASNNGVDNIRDLREEAYFMPAVAKYRVYILDECHMLSAGAVNALLKILEEPPEHVIFILATTEIHKVLPTILSRCQRFDFKRIKSRVIADRLLYVCGQEQVPIDDDSAMLIARLSDGGMRDALSLLDLCISHSDTITVQAVTEAVGLGGQDRLFELADAIADHDPAQALRVIGALNENSIDFSRLCEQIVGHYRNLMLAKTLRETGDLIQATPEDLLRLQEQGKRFTMDHILYALGLLQNTMGSLSRTAFKRTELEMAVVRLCDERLGDGLEGVLERLEKLERMVRTGAAAVQESAGSTPEPAAAPPKKPAKASPGRRMEGTTDAVPAAAPADGNVTEVAPFQNWAQVLAELQKSNGALYGAMVESRAYTKGDMMLIECGNELFLTLLRTSIAAKESLRDAILSVTGQKYNLGPYNPQKYRVNEKEPDDPVDAVLDKARALEVPVDVQ